MPAVPVPKCSITRRLTVKLRGRTEAHDGAEGAHCLSAPTATLMSFTARSKFVRSRLAIWAPLPLTRYAVMIPVHLYVRAVREEVLRLGTRSHLRAVSASIAVEGGLMRFSRDRV